LTEDHLIELDGRQVPYTIRKSRRARRCWLRVTPEDGLVVVLPHGLAQKDVPSILRDEARWVVRQLERLDALPAAAVPRDLRDGAEVMFRGEPRILHVIQSPPNGKHARVRPNGKVIYVDLHPSHNGALKRVLQAWMQNQARWIIRAEVHDLAEEHGFEYNRVYVRDQRTKWGSCSSRRNLSFNWRLVMAPPPVLRYLVAHELAHLKQFRHSREFWALVESVCPDFEQAKQWLHDYGHTLRL